MASGAHSHVPLPPSPGEQPSLTSRRAGWGFSQHTCFQDVEAEFPVGRATSSHGWAAWALGTCQLQWRGRRIKESTGTAVLSWGRMTSRVVCL